ncbi:MAG: C-terminal four region of protein-O-mannosyltransferase, partial [Actinomycetota bacterium]|nr:C-terminal four region of protein-O-mannosyltransferase [Actinomycetota bacterium]
LPALPFMYLALGYVAIDLARRTVGRVVVAIVALFAVGAFAFYYPVLTYVPMSRGSFDARLFAFKHCERRQHAPLIFFKRRVVNGSVRFERTVEPAAPHLEPLGWCWLP